MSARNVNLTDYLNTFVDSQVDSGRHQNASEVVREALRRYDTALIAETERVKAIRHVIQEGRAAIARGDFTTIATERDTEALFSRLTRRDAVPGSASHA
jgi:antitoxin ParD1/3/4